MRIIVANYRFFIAGGPEKYMFKFMEAAEKKGIEIIPFSVNNPQNENTPYSKFFAKPRSKQLMYADTKKSISNIFGMIRATVWNYDAEYRLRKLIRYTNPDVVYILHEVNHLSPSIIRACKKEGVRVVHRISDFFMFCPKYDFLCGNEICESCLYGDYKKAIEMKCVKGSKFATLLRVFAMKLYEWTNIYADVDQFVCTCEFTKGKLIEGGIPENKITCIPTFIDATRINPSYEHGKYFLFLGRMAHQKGVFYAIEAMKYLKNSDYVLKITGSITESKEDQEILRFIKDNNLEKKIIFTGFLTGENLENLIKNATCVVCPAIWYENMPNTVIESYAYGKPVVASRVGSLAEIIDDGKTGFLFEMKNSYMLAEKLKKFIYDYDLASIMGENAREKCEKEYNVDCHFRELIPVLLGRNDGMEGNR